MRGGLTPPAVAVSPYLLILLLCALLPGCSLFSPGPPPAPIVESEPELVASEPEAASAPEAASEPEPENGASKPAPRRARPAPARRRPPAPPPPAPTPAPSPPPPPPLVTLHAIEHGTYRTLLDSEVQKPDGKVVGRAVDLVAGPGGKPLEVVVNLQGFMGVGDRKASFPWSAVHVDVRPKTPAITLALAPGQQVPDRPKAAPGSPQPGAVEPGATRLPMLDASVERANGSKVGRVVDVLLDASADPLALVLDVSGTLEKRHTIAADWSALRFVTKGNALRAQLEMSDQQIDASPPYASDQPVRAVTPAAPAASAHGAQ